MNTPLAWHYTTRTLLDAICKSGEVASPPRPRSWYPYVWFSLNDVGEPSVVDWDHGVPFIREEDKQAGVGRIGVSEIIAPLNWAKVRPQIHEDFAQRLEQLVRHYGGSEDAWRLEKSPVTKEHWRAAEIWSPTGWSNVPRT